MTSSDVAIWLALLGVVVAVVVPVGVAKLEREWSRAERESESRAANRRRIMLIQVQQKWIKDVYEPSVQPTGELRIGHESWPRAATAAGALVGCSGETLTSLLDRSDAGLLILGGPGSGKTTAALQLAAFLIRDAQRDPSLPMPAVFLLSSWADARSPLEDWLVQELRDSYQVPRDVGRRWVNSGDILPVLDGLDRVPAEAIGACLDAVLEYGQQFGVRSMILTCRTEQFANRRRPAGIQAVELQELTEEQMLEHLPSAATSSFSRLFIGGREIPLFRTPLLLNFLTVSQNASTAIEPGIAVETNAVFTMYVGRMLAQRAAVYPARQSIWWLCWLAQSMQRLHVTEFRVDRLDLNWVQGPAASRWVQAMVALFAGGMVGLVDGIVYGVIHGPRAGLINGGVIGVFFTLFDGLGQLCARARLGWWKRAVAGAAGGAGLGVAIWLVLDVTDGVIVGFVFVCVFAAFAGWLRTDPVERLTWSPQRSSIGLLAGSLLGVVVGLSYGRGYGLVQHAGPITEFTVTFMLAFGACGALLGGLRPGMTESQFAANEGTRRSVTRSLISVLVAGPLSGLVLGIEFHRLGLPDGFGAGLRDGILLGMAVGTLIGGLSALQHLALRILLFATYSMPGRYVRFLDQACDQLILDKAGSGYLFRHPLLLDYLAELKPEEMTRIAEQVHPITVGR